MRRARWKRKNVRDELTVEAANSPIRKSGRYALPAKSRSPLPAALTDIPRITASPHLVAWHSSGCKEDTPLLLFLLPLPIPKRGFQRGGPQPAPLWRFKGGRGETEIPPRFSLGGRGGILFSKENIPLASPYRTGTVPPGTPVIFSARRKENGDSIRCGIAAHLRTNLVCLISQKKSSAFCGGNRPPAGARTR